jgi:murein tripeptide amidase MpaA
MAAYHVLHTDKHDGKPAFSTVETKVIGLDGKSFESMPMQSLKNDLAELRKIGAASDKGIVDASVVSIGKSTFDRDILAIKIGHGAKHKVFVNGCHHAREWVSIEVPFLLAKYLVENYEKDPTDPKKKRIKHLLENREVWIVPMCNPDGHMWTITNDRGWRANRAVHVFDKAQDIVAERLGGGAKRKIHIKKESYTGVDMNRNYPEPNWGKEAYHRDGLNRTTSRDPEEGDVWCGPEAKSEVETQVLVELHEQQKFRGFLTCHNFSQLLMYPDVDAAEKDQLLQFVGKGMSKLIDEHGNRYVYGRPRVVNYSLTGGAREFQYHSMPGRPAFTVELRPKKGDWDNSFSSLPAAQIEPNFTEMLGAMLGLVNCAGFDAPAGKATAKVAGADPVAQVVRNGIEPFVGWKP